MVRILAARQLIILFRGGFDERLRAVAEPRRTLLGDTEPAVVPVGIREREEIVDDVHEPLGGQILLAARHGDIAEEARVRERHCSAGDVTGINLLDLVSGHIRPW